MGLADRFVGSGAIAPSTAPEITCRRYDAVPGTKRCKHYLKGGACSLPDEFMCVEWLKANGHHVPASLPPVEGLAAAEQPAVEARPVVDRDLFGLPVPPRPAKPATAADRDEPARDEAPVVRNLTDEDVASFKALGVQVCLATADCGEIWLVPEYTGRDDRKELSVRDAATLAAVCSAFPGARVTSYEKSSPDEPK